MKEILIALFGAVVSYLLPFMVKTIIFIFRRQRPALVCGKWFGYLWWTKNGEIHFDEMNVNIKKGILSEYSATYSDSEGTYVGKAFIECNNLCINASLKGAAKDIYEGTTFVRYDLSTFENRNKLYGFWLSRNADKKVSCGGAILSRRKINKPQSIEIIKNQYYIDKDSPVLSLLS